jgi:hypothetical protein
VGNFDQNLYFTLSLTVEQAARILRFRVLNDDPDVLNHFNTLGFDDGATNTHPVGLNEFKTWLHRLYLNTVVPPRRDSKASVCEQRPNTVDNFFKLASYA